MGAGYSSAIVAKKIYPDRRVVAVLWDGGLMINLGDLITVVRLQLDLTILVLNDNAYGMIKRKQFWHNFDDWGLDLVNPDFVKLAESMWAKGYRIKNLEDFSPLFQKVGKQKGVHLIEVPIIYAEKFF
jgi:acetolactate synthase-1/2/3 large subunit